jgi:hypothetical protein
MAVSTSFSADDSWSDLHRLHMEMRDFNGWSIKFFISLLGLCPTPFYIQMLCRGGASIPPSLVRGTKGYRLRELLSRYLNQDQISVSNGAVARDNTSLQSRVEDWCYDNELSVLNARLSSISLTPMPHVSSEDALSYSLTLTTSAEFQVGMVDASDVAKWMRSISSPADINAGRMSVLTSDLAGDIQEVNICRVEYVLRVATLACTAPV